MYLLRILTLTGILILTTGLLALSSPAQPAESSRAVGLAQSLDDRATFVDSLLSLMTLEEKLGQLAQYPSEWSDTGPSVPAGRKEDVRAGKVGSFLSHYGAEATQEMQEIAVTESRLGIPLLFAYDVIHGYRTIFPIPLGEASSFNPALARRTARAATREATAGGIHWTFAPMVDLSREPRWGRVMEGAGEDPYLNSVLARARVKGFQNGPLDADTTVMATAKHFVGYGAPQAGRDYHTVDVSERTLHEIYLPPVYAALDAGARSVMPGFNEIAGVPMHAHDRLIDGLLRTDWGWDGVVVSDYTGVWELKKHGIAETNLSAGIQALEAGVDVDMVSGIYGDTLDAAVRSGQLYEKEVNEAVRRVLRAKWELGLFEDPYRYGSPERENEVILSDSHRSLARTAAHQSMVLLKNDEDVLPLGDDVNSVAVIGPLANDARSVLGEWAGAGREEDAISILEGLHSRDDLDVQYVPGLPDVRSTDTSGVTDAVAAARQADAAVLVLGEHFSMSGEAASRTSIDLPGRQKTLAQAVAKAEPTTAAVLLNGRPLALPTLDETVPAILEAWYPGTEAGAAVADVLFGNVNPSGKLPITFPRTTGQIPIFYNHKNTGRPPVQGQDYTSTYLDTHWTPLYPFGHGLSYTTFSYGSPTVNADSMTLNDTLHVTVDVTNTGDRPGTEVVQLYVQDSVASITPRAKELRGAKRIHLDPGDTQTVRFPITVDDLTFYGPDMNRIVEPGHFRIHVGTSSVDVQTTSFQFVGSTTSVPLDRLSDD